MYDKYCRRRQSSSTSKDKEGEGWSRPEGGIRVTSGPLKAGDHQQVGLLMN